MSWLSNALHMASQYGATQQGTAEQGPGNFTQRIVGFLPALVDIIKNIETALGPGNGATKKAAAAAAFVSILKDILPFVDLALPQYKAIIDESVDFLVKLLNAYENLSGKGTAAPTT